MAVDSVYPADRLYHTFAALNERFPHLRIELIETILSGSNELLLERAVPIAISPSTPPGFPAEPLIRIEFLAVTAPTHPLAAMAQINHDKLKAHRQIVCRDSGQKEPVDGGWLQAEQRWTVSALATSVDLIQRGFGYARLPRNRIADLLAGGQLREIDLMVGQTRTVELFLVVGDEDSLGPAARHLVEALRAQKSSAPC